VHDSVIAANKEQQRPERNAFKVAAARLSDDRDDVPSSGRRHENVPNSRQQSVTAEFPRHHAKRQRALNVIYRDGRSQRVYGLATGNQTPDRP
jgi:hypothetical protein